MLFITSWKSAITMRRQENGYCVIYYVVKRKRKGAMRSVLIKCQSCGTVNRVAGDKLNSTLKCGNCQNILEYPSKSVVVTSKTFRQEVTDWPGVVLVDFWSTTCAYCLRLNPILDQLATKKAGLLKIAKVNVQYEPALSSTFHIMGTPTLLLYQHGKQIDKVVGALSPQQLVKWLQSKAGV
ncbi:MAG TPA: thiol reductase thioredoxin [Candidatus Margulisbacteria bacterium]|nr:thiol reductase thioredoxin [Candidatus Margulisiibacteriota bacterium]